MTTASVKVFVSYSHDSPEHAGRVLTLADQLRAEGVDAEIDRYEEAPPQGWPRWMAGRLEWADFVLAVVTETYGRRFSGREETGRGLGATWEGAILTQALYEAAGENSRVIPVVFCSADVQHRPTLLKSTTYYDLSVEGGYERLYRRLTGQPEVQRAPLGELRPLPPRQSHALPTTVDEGSSSLAVDAWVRHIHGSRYQAHVEGSGAVAQGPGAVAASAGGTAVGRDLNFMQGTASPDAKPVLQLLEKGHLTQRDGATWIVYPRVRIANPNPFRHVVARLELRFCDVFGDVTLAIPSGSLVLDTMPLALGPSIDLTMGQSVEGSAAFRVEDTLASQHHLVALVDRTTDVAVAREPGVLRTPPAAPPSEAERNTGPGLPNADWLAQKREEFLEHQETWRSILRSLLQEGGRIRAPQQSSLGQLAEDARFLDPELETRLRDVLILAYEMESVGQGGRAEAAKKLPELWTRCERELIPRVEERYLQLLGPP